MRNLFLCVIAISFLSSCTKKSEESRITGGSEFNITDDIGIEVKLPSRPKTVISMAPNVTEAIYALGADSMLAGVTTYCTYPPEAKNKTKIGDYINPDYEVITSLKPDLVFLNVENSSNPTYQALENLGIKVYVINIDNFDGVMNMMSKLGRILGKEERANHITDSLSAVRDEFKKEAERGEPPGAFIIIASNPLMTAGGSTFINDIIKMAGLRNIYENEENEYPSISFEDVIVKDPEYIILPTDTTNIQSINSNLEEIRKSLSTTKAVKEGRVLIIDADVLFRPGPRVLDGVSIIRSKM